MSTTTTQIDYAYLQERLTKLGISDEQNTFTRVWKNASDKLDEINTAPEQKRDYKILDADEAGNIVIQYFNLEGQPYRWKKEDTKQVRDFIRKRLKEPKENFKYWQEKGSPQFPYFPKDIIRKYKLAKHGSEEEQKHGVIETLFIVEGEIKSIKASLCGIDIVGLPSIHGFYNGDIKGKMHEDIQELIITCKVKKIVFLVDADLISVKWEDGKDLSKRPYSFYGAIKAFRESLQLLLDDESVALELAYFMHIRSKFMHEDAKGLDDLLCKYPDRVVEIQEDLYLLNYPRKYFEGYSILDQNKDVHNRIFKLLGLADEQDFYKTYQEFIGPREFTFKRRRYVYNQEERAVTFVKHEDADKYMRIGPDWVKVITKLNKHGKMEEEIIAWKISEIQRDYAKKFPNFIEQIPRYDDFCNEPNWNGSYKRIHDGCLNLCAPLKHEIKEGGIATTVKFIKHIFQGAGIVHLDDQGRHESETTITGDPFTVAMDWLTILLKHPKHMLPVPILVSPENGTGKSTFLKWLQAVFGSNMCILGNQQFQMKFNGHYITKFIIAIDEGFLEVDKKAEKERLKQLVTADSAYLENKGMNVRKINYYGKLIICSNDADRVMKIEDGESRWFVVKVPIIPRIKLTGKELIDRGYKNIKGKEIDPVTTYEVPNVDPDMENRMEAEIPAFLHYLHNRHIHHPRVNRLWFDPEWFITDQFKVIVEATKNRIDRVFEDWICEQFLTYKVPVLRYSLKQLTEIFNDQKNSKYKLDGVDIKAYLEKQGLKPEVTQRVKSPFGFDMPEEGSLLQPKIIYNSVIARPYKFIAEEWLSAEQLEEWKKPLFTHDGQFVTKVEEVIGKSSENTDDLPF